jgi:hypothetical protein
MTGHATRTTAATLYNAIVTRNKLIHPDEPQRIVDQSLDVVERHGIRPDREGLLWVTFPDNSRLLWRADAGFEMAANLPDAPPPARLSA